MSYSVTSVKLCTALGLAGVMLMSGCSTAPPVEEQLQLEEVTISDEEISVDVTPEVDITPEPVYVEPEAVYVEPTTPTYEEVQNDYVVQKGDTLWGIAKSHNCSIADLVRWNDLRKSDLLSIGQVLRVGSSSQGSTYSANSGESHIIAKGDTLWGISRRYNCSVAELKSWNNLTASHVLSVGQELRVSQ